MNSLKVWEGDFGIYLIPERFYPVKVTKTGWPDRRQKLYSEFMAWVDYVEWPNRFTKMDTMRRSAEK
jgi:hypothetical protein